MPHVPQWLASLCVSVSHPSLKSLLQLANPSSHCKPHVPLTQRAEPLAPLAQVVVQSPQWVTALSTFVSQLLELA